MSSIGNFEADCYLHSDEIHQLTRELLRGYHPTYYRLWLDADYRLVWHVMDDEQTVEIEYVGPKIPDLYERLGLGRPKP